MKRKSKLATYEAKRDFAVTPEPPPDEPAPAADPTGPLTFMVHKHDARRLHYDLRLEMEGVLASWAVPKGPSYDPRERRLAVQTEDHPFEYGSFEGRIPDGEYGGGDSIIWDRGVYQTVPPGHGPQMRDKGHVEFVLMGDKLKGRWHLVRTRRSQGGKTEWLLFKGKDEFANERYDVVAERPESVVSGRRVTRGPIAAAVREARPDALRMLLRVWPPPARRLAASVTRALVGFSHGKVALQSDEGRDLAAAHPAVAKRLAAIRAYDAILDGDVVTKGRGAFVAHDLLWLDGEDLRARPAEDRRELLATIVGDDAFELAPRHREVKKTKAKPRRPRSGRPRAGA
jgi:bifunctional non-homologous end joining protein LigD